MSNWFYMLILYARELVPMRQYMLDSLALGPHGTWLEPETLELAWAGNPGIGNSVTLAITAMADGIYNEPVNAAAYLQGMLQDLDFDRSLSNEQTRRALEPLWARSAQTIFESLDRLDTETLQNIVLEAETTNFARRVAFRYGNYVLEVVPRQDYFDALEGRSLSYRQAAGFAEVPKDEKELRGLLLLTAQSALLG